LPAGRQGFAGYAHRRVHTHGCSYAL
jgi:hypothetical protein